MKSLFLEEIIKQKKIQNSTLLLNRVIDIACKNLGKKLSLLIPVDDLKWGNYIIEATHAGFKYKKSPD